MFQVRPEMTARTTANDELRRYALNEYGHPDALGFLQASARRRKVIRLRLPRLPRPRPTALPRAHACAVSASPSAGVDSA